MGELRTGGEISVWLAGLDEDEPSVGTGCAADEVCMAHWMYRDERQQSSAQKKKTRARV